MGRDTSFEQRTREEVARIEAEEAADALRAKAAEVHAFAERTGAPSG
jgi:hypothetical protein